MDHGDWALRKDGTGWVLPRRAAGRPGGWIGGSFLTGVEEMAWSFVGRARSERCIALHGVASHRVGTGKGKGILSGETYCSRYY